MEQTNSKQEKERINYGKNNHQGEYKCHKSYYGKVRKTIETMKKFAKADQSDKRKRVEKVGDTEGVSSSTR